MNKDTLNIKTTASGTKIFLNSKFIKNCIRKHLLNDCSEKDRESIEAQVEALYENTPEDMANEIFIAAMKDVAGSGLEADDTALQDNFNDLKDFQEEIHASALEDVIKVSLCPDYMFCAGKLFEVEINGKVAYGRVPAMYVQGLISGISYGMKSAKFLEIETNAGKIIAQKYDCPETPGIDISMFPTGYSRQFELAMVEVKHDHEYLFDDEKDDDVLVYEWRDVTTDDYTDKFRIRRDEIEETLGKYETTSFDMVLIERPNDEGLEKSDIIALLNKIESKQVIPIEFQAEWSSAMGYITVEAAERINYCYTDKSELAETVRSILEDMEKESEDGVYRADIKLDSVETIQFWMSR